MNLLKWYGYSIKNLRSSFTTGKGPFICQFLVNIICHFLLCSQSLHDDFVYFVHSGVLSCRYKESQWLSYGVNDFTIFYTIMSIVTFIILEVCLQFISVNRQFTFRDVIVFLVVSTGESVYKNCPFSIPLLVVLYRRDTSYIYQLVFLRTSQMFIPDTSRSFS